MSLILLVLAVSSVGVRGDAEAEAHPAYISHHGTPHHPVPAYHPTTYAPVTPPPYRPVTPPPYHPVTPPPYHPVTPPPYNPVTPPPYHPVTPPYHVTQPYEAVTPAYHGVTPAHHPVTPAYEAVTPAYHSVTPAYPTQAYAHASYHPHRDVKPGYEFKCYGYDQVPTCSYNTTQPWCLYDYEYPLKDMEAALHYFKPYALALYADVADLHTGNSVDRPKTLSEETYLCPSETSYVRPLRAINTQGYWRTIVNNVKLDYEVLTQTTRVEECQSYAECPKVPICYDSKCLQKYTYHRFLIYEPCDEYFPFSVETFQLPASCACLLGASSLDH